jgi:hypothetical protein
MTTNETPDVAAAALPGKPKHRHHRRRTQAPPAGGGAVYGIGMIGALAYFLRTAQTTNDQLLAFPKAVVWPALLVYKAFERLDR